MTPTRFAQAADIATTQTTIATVPAGKKWIVKEIVLTNTANADRTVTVWLNGVEIVCVKTVKLYDLIVLALSTVMEAGETIDVSASVATSINVTVSGVEV